MAETVFDEDPGRHAVTPRHPFFERTGRHVRILRRRHEQADTGVGIDKSREGIVVLEREMYVVVVGPGPFHECGKNTQEKIRFIHRLLEKKPAVSRDHVSVA